MKMTRQNEKKTRRNKNVTKNMVMKAINDNPNITIEDIAELIGYTLTDAKKHMKRYRKNGCIGFDDDFNNFIVLQESLEEKERKLKEISKELYQWKQSEYLKMYLDGRKLVNGTGLRATERVKQNELNYKILKAIDDPIVLTILQEEQGE